MASTSFFGTLSASTSFLAIFLASLESALSVVGGVVLAAGIGLGCFGVAAFYFASYASWVAYCSAWSSVYPSSIADFLSVSNYNFSYSSYVRVDTSFYLGTVTTTVFFAAAGLIGGYSCTGASVAAEFAASAWAIMAAFYSSSACWASACSFYNYSYYFYSLANF